MDSQNLSQILSEDTEYEITNSEAQMLLDEIDVVSIESSVNNSINVTKLDLNSDKAGQVIQAFGVENPGEIYQIEDGKSTHFEIDPNDISIRKDQLIQSKINGEIINRALKHIDIVLPPEPPEPDEAYQQISQYFIDQEASTDAGLDRIDQLMSSYPSADRSLANKNYDIFKNRISKAQSDGMLTSQETSDLTDIVDGK